MREFKNNVVIEIKSNMKSKKFHKYLNKKILDFFDNEESSTTKYTNAKVKEIETTY